MAAVPRRTWRGPEPFAARDVAGFSGPVMRPGSLPRKLRARRRDRGLVGPEARDPTSGNVRCPRRPRRERSVRHRGSQAARARGAARLTAGSPPRDRIAARPPRRRGGSGNRGPLRWDHTPRGPGASAVPDRLRSRTVQDPLPRSREAAGTKVGAPGEGTAGRDRDAVPADEGVGCESFPEGLLALFLGPVCLGHAWRGAMSAALFRLVLGGGGRRLGKPCSLGAAGREVRIIKWFRGLPGLQRLFGLDLAEFALAVAFPVEIPLRSRSRSRSGSQSRSTVWPRGTLGFSGLCGGCSRRGAGGSNEVGSGGGAAGWSAASRSSTNPSPNRRGISDRSRRPRTDRSGRSRSRSGRDLGPVTVSVSVLGAWWSRKRGGKRLVRRFGS